MNRYIDTPKNRARMYQQLPLIAKWVYNLMLMPYPYQYRAKVGKDFKYILNK